MDWLILFIASWILFILLVDWKHVYKNALAGLFAMVLQFSVDSNAIIHNLYKIENKIIPFFQSELLFMIGPVFVIGTLLSQYHPQKRIMIILNAIILSALYSAQEWLLLKTGSLIYTNWHFMDSVIVNISAMIIISWFSIIVLNKGKVK